MYNLNSYQDYFRNWKTGDKLSKNICRMGFWSSVLIGLILMTYSRNYPADRISPMFNLKPIYRPESNLSLYQAQVTCSAKFFINLLDNCNIDSWIVPPVCPTLYDHVNYQVYSWGPVVFKCDNQEFLQPFAKYNYDTPDQQFYWYLGAFLTFGPLIVLCVMFATIGLFQYTRRRQDPNYNVSDFENHDFKN